MTGSNGKTTTCHLIHRIFRSANRSSVLCGNIGTAFLDSLKKIHRRTAVVLELSSFQLQDSPTFRPHVAVLTNLCPNHLDRHKTFQNYVKSKEAIFKNQTANDYLVLNADDPRVRRMAKKARSRVIFYSKKPRASGVWLTENAIRIHVPGFPERRFRRDRLKLLGDHNLENLMAAVAAATVFRISPAAIQRTLNSFKTLEHRIEPLGELRGVRFVNDSKSTTVDSTRAAVLSCPGQIVLVAGGRDKGAPFSEIEDLLLQKAGAVVLYGEARRKIRSAWKRFRPVLMKDRFRDAVELAVSRARPGETILLSPMCTSFDQFNSFEERGEYFKEIFKELKTR